MPQEVNLDAFFSPKQLLELQAGLYGISKRDRITDLILKMVSLDGKAHAYSRSLSGGMKRRLLIAKAMVHQPPILILDEPTAGVDVELRNNLWNNVKKLNKEGAICLSGILEGQINIIKDAYLKYFNLSEIKIKDGWVMMSGIKL